MSVGVLVRQSVCHLVQENQSETAWRSMVRWDGEVGGGVLRWVESLSIVVDGQHQLFILHTGPKGDARGLAIVDDIRQHLFHCQAQTIGFLLIDSSTLRCLKDECRASASASFPASGMPAG